MERKLASVQVIRNLKPIEGADFIEKARVMGWNCVVKKGEFQVGDKCIYIEIDSMLPRDAEWASFMEPRGFRVKTAKLRGCLSQGLAMPLSILDDSKVPNEAYKEFVSKRLRVDDDVTETLGITKYDPPLPGGEVDGPFPGEIPKTDEMRVQSVPDILDELKNKPFYVTIKLDGTSGTFFKKDGKLVVCGRSWSLKEGEGYHWRVAKKYELAEKLPEGFCVQGEVCGPGIQKNRLELKEHDLFIFNVYDTNIGRYLSYDQMVMFCHQNGLKTVPYAFDVDLNELEEFPFTVENFLELAKGKYEGTNNRREGIVIRPVIETQSDALGGDRFSFKAINNEFLLKDED